MNSFSNTGNNIAHNNIVKPKQSLPSQRPTQPIVVTTSDEQISFQSTQKPHSNNEEVKVAHVNVNDNHENYVQQHWETWVGLEINPTAPRMSGNLLYLNIHIDTPGINVQGLERTYSCHDGVKFDKVVQILLQELKIEDQFDSYTERVQKRTRNVVVTNGFKLQKVLGAGNMGTAILAYDMQEKKQVVLKIYHQTGAISSGIQEFKMLYMSKLAPSIVKVGSIMYNDRGSYLAISMEDLSALTTFYNIAEDGDFTARNAMLVARNSVRALAELHELGIVHGDIASENVLVNAQTLDVKLIDFDLAALEGRLVIPAGNPDFIPECIAKKLNSRKLVKSETANDVFSMGLLCYLVLGDQKKLFFKSLSEETPLTVEQKLTMVAKETFPGCDVVLQMLKMKITAKVAAEEFNALLQML